MALVSCCCPLLSTLGKIQMLMERIPVDWGSSISYSLPLILGWDSYVSVADEGGLNKGTLFIMDDS